VTKQCIFMARSNFEIESNDSSRMIRVCHWRQTQRGIIAAQYSRVLYSIHLQEQHQESKQGKRAVLMNSNMSSKTLWTRSGILAKVLIFAMRIGRNFNHYRVSETSQQFCANLFMIIILLFFCLHGGSVLHKVNNECI
jgi:hypothetical protein